MLKPLTLILTLCASMAFAEAAKDYRKSCQAGDQDACLRGTQLAQRDGQTDLLLDFITQGCALGNVISCSDRGMMYITGIAGDIDIPKGRDLVRKGCRDGYSRACANLGYLYYSGTGVTRSLSKAARFYKKGCDGRSGPACRNLALMYMEGEGVRADGAKAAKLLDRACDLGHQPAC